MTWPFNSNKEHPGVESLIKARRINICHQNVRGLSGSYARVPELLQSFPGLHVLSLNETHVAMRSEHVEVVHDNAGWPFISHPRNYGKGGGVGICSLDGINWDRREDLENENVGAIWLKFRHIHSNSFLLCIMYRLPENSKYLSKDFNSHLLEMLSKASERSQGTILLGDLNVNFLKQDNSDLKSMLQTIGFKQMSQKPTRTVKTSETPIDVILTNKPYNVVTTKVIPTSIGDHDMIGCTRKIKHFVSNRGKISTVITSAINLK